ncbi:MAG: hypothetical protein U9R50_03815 [Campylobacterota bacterium]|nr:hypothetical protein [Campylobacterota bacterium]
MSTRLIAAPIAISFDILNNNNKEDYEREYHQLSEADDDPISQWLKMAKARGETSESDPVMLKLMVELHRKVDNLETLIKNEKPKRLELSIHEMIESIGFENFKLKHECFEIGQYYYGRLEMPVHPKRDVGIFFKAENKTLAKIEKMHDRDIKEWGSYLTARERVMIREMRGES